jgi:RNA polymerase sigma-70 factor (ECF subfamily)
MSISTNSSTKLSLLAKLADDKGREDVWPTFVEKYGKAIYAWCLKWGASSEDAEDIVQQTLLTVFLKLEHFKHGGRYTFRGWLRQIARHTWLKIIEKSAKATVVDTDEMERLTSIKLLKTIGARDDLISSFDQLACEEIRDMAFSKVRERVSAQTWQAYIMSDHDQSPGIEIASRLGMTIGAVRLSAYRVRLMLNDELARIDPTIINDQT